MDFTEIDLQRGRRCIELAAEAAGAGDEAFGSILVGEDGTILAEDRNRIAGGDRTQHPEFALARWAAENLTEDERRGASVYTSGEHCPMCSAAHAWVGLGEIVYVASAAQFAKWMQEWGYEPGPVAPLPIQTVAPGIPVRGPIPGLDEEVRELHRQVFFPRQKGAPH